MRELGSANDRVQFTVISDGFIDSDGSVVVADGREARVVRIAMDDAWGVELGAAGDGPGEFRSISGVGANESFSPWVADRRTGKITLFPRDPEAELRTATVRDYFFAPPLAPEGPVALLADGNLLVSPSAPEVRPLFPDTLVQYHLVRVTAGGGVVDTLLSPPPAALDGLLLSRADGGFTMTRKLLAEPPLIAVSPTGADIGFLHRTEALDGATIGVIHHVRVDRARPDARTLRVPGAPVRGGRAELERRARSLDIAGFPGGSDAFVEAVSGMVPIPDWVSPIVAYRIDSERAHWVAVEEDFRGAVQWLRLADRGTVWEPVTFDRPVPRVLDARGDHVVGVLVDPFDVNTLGLFQRCPQSGCARDSG